MLSLVFVGVLLFALILDGFPGRDRECVYVGSYYHKVCFVGPKDNARTIFLFVALLSQLHFFSSPQDILQEKRSKL